MMANHNAIFDIDIPELLLTAWLCWPTVCAAIWEGNLSFGFGLCMWPYTKFQNPTSTEQTHRRSDFSNRVCKQSSACHMANNQICTWRCASASQIQFQRCLHIFACGFYRQLQLQLLCGK